MNFEGLKRRGFSPERLAAVKAMYKVLYREELTLEQAKIKIAELVQKFPQADADVMMMSAFLSQTLPQRGIVR
jgi:UDP-N-acetylglucosamine acyltransferase